MCKKCIIIVSPYAESVRKKRRKGRKKRESRLQRFDKIVAILFRVCVFNINFESSRLNHSVCSWYTNPKPRPKKEILDFTDSQVFIIFRLLSWHVLLLTALKFQICTKMHCKGMRKFFLWPKIDNDIDL